SRSAAAIAAWSEVNMLPRDLIEPVRPADPGQRADVIADVLARRIVDLDDHEGVAATLFPRDAKGRDVDPIIGEQAGDAGDAALHVLGDQHNRVMVAVHLDREAVDLREEHAAGAER